MQEKIVETSINMLKDCLGLKAGETFLIVSDDSRKELAESLYEAGKRIGAESMLTVMKERSKSGEEPLRRRSRPPWRRRRSSFASRSIR